MVRRRHGGRLLELMLVSVLASISCGPTGKSPKTQASVPVPRTPSERTRRLLLSLDKPLKLTLFASPGFGTIDALVPGLDALLAGWVAEGRGLVRYGHATDAEADKSGIGRRPIRESSELAGAPWAPTEGYLALVMQHGESTVTLYQDDGLDPRLVDGLESRLRMALRELVARERKQPLRIGFIEGHGERGLEPLAELEHVHPHLRFEPILLGDEPPPIDPTLQGLFVFQPASSISAKALQRIDALLMAGRAVTIVASGVVVDVKSKDLPAHASWNGIRELLAGYGIVTSATLPIDRRQFWVPQASSSTFTLQLDPYPYVFVAPRAGSPRSFDDRSAPLFALPALVMPLPTSLSLQPRTDGASAHVVVRTLPSILPVEVEGLALHPARVAEPKSITPREEAATLGVLVEGTIRSAFSPTTASSPSARLLVLSTGALLGNFFAEAADLQALPPTDRLREHALLYQPLRAATLRLLKQTSDWMADD